MAQLVTDDHADGAIVDRIIRLQIEVGRLQYGCREDDLVVVRAVVGVHRLRIVEPLLPIHRLMEAGKVLVVTHRGRALGIADQIIGTDLDCAVIQPLVGIADLDPYLGQFRQRLLFGRGRHPVEPTDLLAIGSDQIAHHGRHLCLGFCREVALHVEFAHRLTQIIVQHLHGLLPGLPLPGMPLRVVP